MAVRVWQVLLELGILLSVDQRVVFGDSNSYYQFSFEECESAACEFCGLEKEAWPEAVRLLLQLVPYVQFRTGYLFFQSRSLQLGGGCVRPDGVCGREELTRLELVQRLAADSCRLLQNQNYRVPDHRNPTVCWYVCIVRVCVCVSPRLCLTFLCVCLFRYVVVSGTPLKILEHLLSDLRLDDQRGLLLDDFLLTYLVFMTTNDLCQALLGQYPLHTDGKEALYRKRKVLHLVAHWTRLYKDFLREDEHIKAFMKVGGDTHRFGNQFVRVIAAPLTDSELSRRTVRLLGINTWDMAAVLTQLDWNLFNSIHEQELVYSTMSCSTGGSHREGLSVLLQRCNEVQQWVMSEVLMCVSLNKRVQLLKKFIKIAAHCKAQRNLNSAFAIIMGLNTAAVSRLNITWEKVPGKFKKIFSELELITDPSLNHKAYRDAFKKMKPPKIPFMPLLLKDITFIHEGNKTFQDNLVNFQKLHMIADTVRLIRHCQSDQLGMLSLSVSLSVCQCLASVHYLHIIDNQQTLFQLSHKLEPRA
uniref:Rap guanine nucleotide exchange factor (GEF) 5a n=1 Tax=Oncorhynchus kisutch TaxID=8019 RepID=A0A8C7D375_ONCKI